MRDLDMSYVEADPAGLAAGPLASLSIPVRPEHAPSRLRGKRVAIVHDWLETFAGSESVLEQLLLCFPDADLYAVVDFLNPADRGFLQGRQVRTSFIQRLPGAKHLFRAYLGLMPLAVEQFDMSGYDVIISSNHAVAKGVVTGPDQVHISYMHSPMRYIWDLQTQYLRQSGLKWGLKALYIRWLFGRLRQWDVSSAQHVDYFIANSSYIGRRLKKAYARDSTVIHPPVDIEHFTPGGRKDDFFLLAGRLVPYKRADLIVECFRKQPHRRLVVVGDGPEASQVRAAAGGAPNIEFRGKVTKTELIDLMQRAQAAIFAAEEDFGITMVEVQACGTPVVAFGRGGVTDIIDAEAGAPTGVLFDRQEADALIQALSRFDRVRHSITAESCRANALRFSRSRFRSEIRNFVEIALG
jgi:glycosyltransferase involved in cell wall biosynthesis